LPVLWSDELIILSRLFGALIVIVVIESVLLLGGDYWQQFQPPVTDHSSRESWVLNKIEQPVLTASDEVIERPLFQKDRKKSVVDILTAAEGPVSGSFSWNLKGIYHDGTVVKAMLVTSSAKREVVKKVVGDKLGHWTIEKITAQKLYLRKAGVIKTLDLFDPKKITAKKRTHRPQR
jgi:hypothetical protein